MPVNVYVPTTYRDLSKGSAHVAVAGKDVTEVIEALERAYPGFAERLYDGPEIRHYINVYINGEEMRSLKGVATPLKDGDEIAFVPAIAGGAWLGTFIGPDVSLFLSGHLK